MTATFKLQRVIPDPPGLIYSGTLLLYQSIGTDGYEGELIAGPDRYHLIMTYPATQGEHAPSADWELGHDADEGDYEFQPLRLPLPLRAYWGAVQAIGDDWRGTLLVTG